MSKQKLEGFFEPIEKTLEMIYDANHLENPNEFNPKFKNRSQLWKPLQ